ncbi:four helix bundle protein [Candidatus Chloroploca sp. Khr17]|uniref:four helix bundle protein n=1 Tax=Candidatus Chloroploca sp. Khr17 TaxID=2496869 RepID=UPI00101CC992|nr:four helix bundle protein [Candidatus Chloroploca sp. Khr17]
MTSHSSQSPIFSQTYDLLRWLLPLAAAMPREHRTGLGRRLPEAAFLLQRQLIAAAKQGHNPTPLLREADITLAELRLLLRLARDLHMLSFKQYEEGARRSSELGRLLGGWLRRGEELSPTSGS